MSCAGRLEIRVAGRLHMVGPQGEIALHGQRRQALVLLLATAPDLRRHRSFIQDKLWSTKDSKRAAASLRQLLSDLRSALGPFRDALVTADGWVGFDQTIVQVRRAATPDVFASDADEPEMAEGLDVEDPEFEDWIRDQRLAFATQLVAQPQSARVLPVPDAVPVFAKPVLVLCPAEGVETQMLAFADMVISEVGFRVARLGGVEVRDASQTCLANPTSTDLAWQNRSIRLRLRAIPAGRLTRVQASACEGASGVLLWSGQKTVDPYADDGGPAGFGQLVNDLTAALYRVIGAPPEQACSSERTAIAVYQAISCGNLRTREGLREAERLLIEAADHYGNPSLNAWQALVKGWRVIERDVDGDAGLEEAFGLARKALDADPLNPTALTVAAELSDIRGGPFDAPELAQMAVNLDGIDAFAAASFAKALMRRGASDRAHREALRAAQLASGHRDQAWWKMLCCVTAVQCGRYDEALRYARTAHELAPGFRPPMRFLLGLYFHSGEEEAVVRTAEQLKGVEPDFCAAALKDPDYPLRLDGTPLLDVAEAGLF